MNDDDIVESILNKEIQRWKIMQTIDFYKNFTVYGHQIRIFILENYDGVFMTTVRKNETIISTVQNPYHIIKYIFWVRFAHVETLNHFNVTYFAKLKWIKHAWYIIVPAAIVFLLFSLQIYFSMSNDEFRLL